MMNPQGLCQWHPGLTASGLNDIGLHSIPKKAPALQDKGGDKTVARSMSKLHPAFLMGPMCILGLGPKSASTGHIMVWLFQESEYYI